MCTSCGPSTWKIARVHKSHQVPLATMVASNIPNGVGKKENEKKSRKRMSNSPRVVANYGNRVEAETLIKNQRIYLFMK